jgi:glycine cleavage system regulatory protein
MFHAHVRAAVPDGVDMTELHGGLERLAADLMVEIRLAEAIGPAR